MKIFVSVLLSVTVFFAAFAQQPKKEHVVVPIPVIVAFHKKFPHATKVNWQQQKNDYEVEFKFQGKNESAVYHPSGKLMETEVEISVQELPKPVTDYLAKNYPGKKIDEAAKITDLDGKIMYEAEIKGKDVILDAQGKVVKK